MIFSGYVNPDQLKVLAKALSEFCQAKGIREHTPDYDEAAGLVVLLFKSGAYSSEELSRLLTKRQGVGA
jgi:hypothetical protein